jgi:hypothetical protein
MDSTRLTGPGSRDDRILFFAICAGLNFLLHGLPANLGK